jgi:hypothetical protein
VGVVEDGAKVGGLQPVDVEEVAGHFDSPPLSRRERA